MSKSHRTRDGAYAVVRIDFPIDQDDPASSVVVKEVLSSEALARAEVERLTRLNAGKGCLYFHTPTRVFPVGSSAGSSE